MLLWRRGPGFPFSTLSGPSVKWGRQRPPAEEVELSRCKYKGGGGHPEREGTGPGGAALGGGHRSQKLSWDWPSCPGPPQPRGRGGAASTCTAVPGGRRRPGPRGWGLKSPFQATMFQVCEQHPPPRSISKTFFLLEILFSLLISPSLSPMIAPSLREGNPPTETGCLGICGFRMAQAGAWSLGFRSRWGGGGSGRMEGGGVRGGT